LAMIVQAELMQFGYILTEEALFQLSSSSEEEITKFHNEVIHYLKDMTGGLRNYSPIYPGFPQQVMEMSELELWFNQIIGYLSGGSFIADEYPKQKGTAFERVNYKQIKSGTEQQFMHIFQVLLSSGQSLTDNDSQVIEWFLENYPNLEFPIIIPFKENLCRVIGKLMTLKKQPKQLPKLTVTDVLRITVYLSGGDISLPKVPRKEIVKQTRHKKVYLSNPERESFKFKKFTRSERRYILYLLENSNLDIREMKLKLQRWLRLGEILHPGEYAVQFPRTYAAFLKIRNDKVTSWYGHVKELFEKDFTLGLVKLSERPGEFLRRLDYLLRNNLNNTSRVNDIIYTLTKVAEGSSNKVVFELYNYLEKRRQHTTRSILIKNSRKRVKLSDLEALPEKLVDNIQEKLLNVIQQKFKSLPELGTCWIDPELKKIPLPTNMRSLNDSISPIIRGERIPAFNPLEEKTIRFFLHWFDYSGSLDLDLHVYLFNDKKYMHFGYNSDHSNKTGCFSGDVRHRQGACAEYVDIKISEATTKNYRYALMVVHNFDHNILSEVKECVVGTMSRSFPEANSNWLPSTIDNAMKVSNSYRMCLVGAYDLLSGEYIHIDIDFEGFDRYVINSEKMFEQIKVYLELPKLSVYDLIKWHVQARGIFALEEEAENKFLFSDFSSSYKNTLKYLGV